MVGDKRVHAVGLEQKRGSPHTLQRGRTRDPLRGCAKKNVRGAPQAMRYTTCFEMVAHASYCMAHAKFNVQTRGDERRSTCHPWQCLGSLHWIRLWPVPSSLASQQHDASHVPPAFPFFLSPCVACAALPSLTPCRSFFFSRHHFCESVLRRNLLQLSMLGSTL